MVPSANKCSVLYSTITSSVGLISPQKPRVQEKKQHEGNEHVKSLFLYQSLSQRIKEAPQEMHRTFIKNKEWGLWGRGMSWSRVSTVAASVFRCPEGQVHGAKWSDMNLKKEAMRG